MKVRKIRCPKCKAKNSVNAKYCYSCQTPLTETVHISKKKCPQCGKTYSADSKYCMKCQCELVAKTSNRLPVIIISSAAVVVLITSAVIGTQVIYPRYTFNKVIRENNSKQLVSICRKHKSLLDDRERLDQYNAFIDKKTDDYINDVISYDEIIVDFENFNIINSYLLNEFTLKNTEDSRKTIEELHKSRLLFEEAEELFDKKSYQNAEENYSGVIKQDEKYYQLAQNRLKEIDELKLSYIKQSEEKLSANDFDESIKILTDGINSFGYDENYNSKYYNAIFDTIVKQSDYLMNKGLYFSIDGEKGAFNIVYSYLNDERYANNNILKSKLVEIATESESSEIASAEQNLGLIKKSKVLDRCADVAAKEYCSNPSIQDDNSYILSLCRNDDGVQELLSNISKDKKVSVALISDIAVTSENFSNVCKDKINAYLGYVWDYTGIGRFYDEQNMNFSWAVIIIYEME